MLLTNDIVDKRLKVFTNITRVSDYIPGKLSKIEIYCSICDNKHIFRWSAVNVEYIRKTTQHILNRCILILRL